MAGPVPGQEDGHKTIVFSGQIPERRYTYGGSNSTLGSGSFGKVKLAYDETGAKVAIKIINSDRVPHDQVKNLQREVWAMQQVQHPNVVNMLNFYQGSRHIYIVMELAERGELFELLLQSGRFPEETVRLILNQTVDGLDACHRAGIVHRDLKPENLLVDAAGNVKISDFGFAIASHGEDGQALALQTPCGSEKYAAPEVKNQGSWAYNEGYKGEGADVWSLAVIVFVLTMGLFPWEAATMSCALFARYANGTHTMRDVVRAALEANGEDPDSRGISDALAQLLTHMLQMQPDQRATLAHIKASQFCSPPVGVGPVEAPPPTMAEASPGDMALDLDDVAHGMPEHDAEGDQMPRAMTSSPDEGDSPSSSPPCYRGEAPLLGPPLSS